MALIEREFGDKVADAAIKYYLSHVSENPIDDDSDVSMISNMLFTDGFDLTMYMESRHYDMKTAENMLSASVLSASMITPGWECTPCIEPANDVDFCVYYDDKINMITMAEDEVKMEYVLSMAIRRGDDYIAELLEFADNEYINKLFPATEIDANINDENINEVNAELIVSNISKMHHIMQEAEQIDNALITHLLIFCAVGDVPRKKFNVMEISPLSTDVVDGNINPIFITRKGKLTVNSDAANLDPLAKVTVMESSELFSKLCELSDKFKINASSKLFGDSDKYDDFIRCYLAHKTISTYGDSKRWSNLLDNGKFSDVEIRCRSSNDASALCSGSVSIRAHKLILATFSEYFEALLYGEFANQSAEQIRILTIDNVEETQMREILTYMYRGYVDFDNIASISELISAADYLRVIDLVKFFEDELYN